MQLKALTGSPSEAHSSRSTLAVLICGRTRIVFIVSMIGTILVVAWLMKLRSGIYEPEAVPIFLSLFLFQDYVAGLLGLGLLALALIPGLQQVGLAFTRRLGDSPGVTALVVLVALAIGARFAYHGHPLAMDEYAPYFQSEVFAAGELAGRFPPQLMDWLVPPGFQQYFLHVSHVTGAIASSYWPGFALLLTPFTLLGVPWLCNPVIGALTVLAIHRLGYLVTGSAEGAGFSVFFLLASPAFTVNSLSFYSMSAHLLLNACFALCLMTPTTKRCFLAGLVGSLALVLHNPLPHTLFAAPWIIWLAADSARRRSLIPLALGYAPLSIIVGAGWPVWLAHIADSRQGDPNFDVSAQGFFAKYAELLRWPTLDLLRARLMGAAKIWLWAAPALVILCFAGWSYLRAQATARLLLFSGLLTFAAYFFFPFDQGHGWGYRYFHSAWFVLPVVAAGAVVHRARSERDALAGYAAACSLGGVVLLNALMVWQVYGFIERHLAQLPVNDSGVARIRFLSPAMSYYGVDLVQNDPFLRDPVIILLSHGSAEDAALIDREFPQLERLSRSYQGTVWGDRRVTSE